MLCQWKCWSMSRLKQNKSKTDTFYVTIHSIQFVDYVSALVVIEWVSIEQFAYERTRMSCIFHEIHSHGYCENDLIVFLFILSIFVNRFIVRIVWSCMRFVG